MSIEELVEYLKTGLFIYDPNETEKIEDEETGEIIEVPVTIKDDPEYLALSDSYLKQVLNVSMSRVDSNKTIESMTQEDIFPTILLARREIYYVLATKSAPLYDLSVAGSSGSSSISRNQRFNHYMSLIEEVNREYKTYLATGIPVQSANVLLTSKYYSTRNYNLAKSPTIMLKVDNIYPKEVEIQWCNIYADRFKDFKVYVSKELPVIDEYEVNIIRDNAKLVKTIGDFHKRLYRVGDLEPNTKYYLAIVIEEMNGLKGYSEVEITTLA